ncbi:MAG: hypothetical protein K6F83_00020 [Clostridiales bacterium]|nr:hypothetical protein [Clostridiales bacterium]
MLGSKVNAIIGIILGAIAIFISIVVFLSVLKQTVICSLGSERSLLW